MPSPQSQDWDGASEGYHVDIAAHVRAAFADGAIREGKADLVAVGTPMLDNPRWAADAIEALAGSSRIRIVLNRSSVSAAFVSAPLAHPTVAAVKVIHRAVLAAHGGMPGIRDEGLLESAVAAPQATRIPAWSSTPNWRRTTPN